MTTAAANIVKDRMCDVTRQKIVEVEPQELRVIPIEDAVVLIENYVTENPGARTSDIICDLGLDPDLTLQVLNRLVEEKRVKGQDIV